MTAPTETFDKLFITDVNSRLGEEAGLLLPQPAVEQTWVMAVRVARAISRLSTICPLAGVTRLRPSLEGAISNDNHPEFSYFVSVAYL